MITIVIIDIQIFQLSSTLGFKCVSQLTTWAYCAADANDNVACCEEKGIEHIV